MKKAKSLTLSAVIAALYAVLTFLSAAFGLGYGPLQFRVSEVLTLLPVFTPSAIWGLTIGCVVSNIGSPNAIDIIVGSLATLIAAVLTRRLRHKTIKGFPFLSALMPVIFNAVFVGAEISLLSTAKFSLGLFLITAVEVAISEFAVVFGLGIPFFLIIKRLNIKF